MLTLHGARPRTYLEGALIRAPRRRWPSRRKLATRPSSRSSRSIEVTTPEPRRWRRVDFHEEHGHTAIVAKAG